MYYNLSNILFLYNFYQNEEIRALNKKINFNKTFKGGTDSDAGTYYCEASNEFGSVRSQEANVRIALLKDDFRVNPHPIQVSFKISKL